MERQANVAMRNQINNLLDQGFSSAEIQTMIPSAPTRMIQSVKSRRKENNKKNTSIKEAHLSNNHTVEAMIGSMTQCFGDLKSFGSEFTEKQKDALVMLTGKYQKKPTHLASKSYITEQLKGKILTQ